MQPDRSVMKKPETGRAGAPSARRTIGGAPDYAARLLQRAVRKPAATGDDPRDLEQV